MLARLSLNPVWLTPDENLLMMRGQRLRLISRNGKSLDTIIKIGMGEAEGGREACSILLADPADNTRQRAYLTEEALQLIAPASKSQRGTDLVLDCRKIDQLPGRPHGNSDLNPGIGESGIE